MAKKGSRRIKLGTGKVLLRESPPIDIPSSFPLNRKDAELKIKESMEKVAAGAELSYFPPRWFSPMLSWVHFYLPTDVKTTYTWIRHWDAFHPLVGNSIDLHTEMPLSRFALKVSDPTIRHFYEDMMEMLGGLLFLYSMVREYWLLGEVYVYLFWDAEAGMFKDAQLLPPEEIEVRRAPWIVSGMDTTRYFVNTTSININPEQNMLDRMVMEYIPPEYLSKIQNNEPIELSPYFVLDMKRTQSAYHLRGTSIILRVLKDLLYEDKIREAQYSVAQRFVTPKELWKVGNDTYPATDAQIQALESLVRQAEQQPLFTLFTNHTVNVEYIGATGKYPDFKAEFDWVENRILTGLFTNKSLTHGEGPCVSEDTLILTDKGFMTYWEAKEHIANGGKIAQFNPETEKIEYVVPLGEMSKHYEGEMVHFTSKVLDHLVTPDHKVWYRTKGTEDWKKEEVENMLQKYEGDILFRSFGKWEGETRDYYEIAGRKIEASRMMELIGFYISEGYLSHIDYQNGERIYSQIRITQQPESKAYERIKDLMAYLKRLGFKVVHRYWNKRKQDWVILSPELAEFIYNNCGFKAWGKFLSPNIKNLSSELLFILLESAVLGDGYMPKDKTFWEYYTTSPKLANDILEIALKVGFPARYNIKERDSTRKTIYRILIGLDSGKRGSRGHFPLVMKQNIKRVPYKGLVYSFGVPSGLIVVMRNGKVVITGNTYNNASVAMRVLMQRYMYIRSMLEAVLISKLFLPVAVVQGFYKSTEAELAHNIRRPYKDRVPILPEFDWRYKSNLVDDSQIKGMVSTLRQMGFPVKVICDILGLDYDDVKKYAEKEQGTIFDPLYDEWRKQTQGKMPAPFGPEARTSSFKLPVKKETPLPKKSSIKNKENRKGENGEVEEKEFSFIERNPLRLLKFYERIKPYLEKGEPVPLKKICKVKPDGSGGLIATLEPIEDKK